MIFKIVYNYHILNNFKLCCKSFKIILRLLKFIQSLITLFITGHKGVLRIFKEVLSGPLFFLPPYHLYKSIPFTFTPERPQCTRHMPYAPMYMHVKSTVF